MEVEVELELEVEDRQRDSGTLGQEGTMRDSGGELQQYPCTRTW
jgi:hypothetical protein